jgi:hypothetical protein
VSQAPSIVIELKRLAGDGAELKFRRTKDGAALPLPMDRASDRIASLRRDLPFLLGDFRRAVTTDDIDLDDARMEDAAFHLRALGYYMLDVLVRGSGFDARSFGVALARHLHPALRTRSETAAPLVEFLAPAGDDLAALLPIEFLPLPNVRESELTAFLAFQAITVRRRAEVTRSPISQVKIPTQFFAYRGADLTGPARQQAYFARHPDLSLARIWPGAAPLAGTAAIQQLAEAFGDLLTGQTQSPRKIAHFHCHFTPGGVNPIGHFAGAATLDFGAGLTIGIHSLRGTFAQTTTNRKGWQGEVLVFLNACQTASMTGIGGSLLDQLFAAGFKHIIGSETLIPDRLAALFAEHVYTALLAGDTLGMAVLRGRRNLIMEHGNPGGVLWSAFGDPDLRLRPASPIASQGGKHG